VAIGATCASVMILIVTVIALTAGRHETIVHARDTSANVAAALTHDMARNLEIYDLSLQAVVDGMADPEIVGLPADLRQQVLFDRSTTAGYISGIYAIDETGRYVQGRERTLPAADLSGRDFFRVHRNDSNAGLFISKPFLSNVRSGTPTIALSRRISRTDGSFGGIALITINLAYFQQLVDDIRLGPHGAATVVQTDGIVVARNPPPGPNDSTSFGNSPGFAKLLESSSGSYDMRSPIDGIERISTFSHVPGSNLIVVVAPAIEDVTDEWMHRALIIGAIVMAVSCAFTAVVWLLVGAVRQRDAAHAKLIEIAETDGLTGVANRRRLDSSLDALWVRSARAGEPVALLFVDADNFKIYNDSYGHEAGDRALRFIAECLRKHARGHADVVARYGGEEFVVALAGLNEARAQAVAEAIRAEVESSRTTGVRPDLPPVTVSIGLVACRPADGAEIDEMMRVADGALYRSKAEGRNRVTAASATLDAEAFNCQVSPS
jgi:diguanylate cyclase (GGDEF)-like protein